MSDCLVFSSEISKRAFGFSSPFDWLTDNRLSPSINREMK